MLDFLHDLQTSAVQTDVQSEAGASTLRSNRGRRNNLAGQTAEEAVLRAYLERGAALIAQRFRSAAGEIDLIFREGTEYVFVEVKSAATWDAALARITPRQVARIHRSAELFAAQTPEGAFAQMRFDAALCDGQGRVSLMEGVLLGY